jgi:hypothetical protein
VQRARVCCACRQLPPWRASYPSLSCGMLSSGRQGSESGKLALLRGKSKPHAQGDKDSIFRQDGPEAPDPGAEGKCQSLYLPFWMCQSKGPCLVKPLPCLKALHHDHSLNQLLSGHRCDREEREGGEKEGPCHSSTNCQFLVNLYCSIGSNLHAISRLLSNSLRSCQC